MKKYIELGLIIILTLAGVYVVRNYYLSGKDYNDNIPVIREVVNNEINSKEIYNYVREDNDSIIYVGVAKDKLCRKYEEEVLKTIITKYHLEDDITYLNLSDTKTIKSFIKEFNKFYGTKLEDYPSIVIFKDGSVLDILTIDDENYRDETITFLLDNGVALNEGD